MEKQFNFWAWLLCGVFHKHKLSEIHIHDNSVYASCRRCQETLKLSFYSGKWMKFFNGKWVE